MGDFRPEFEGVDYYKLGDYLAERVVELVPADTISDTLKQLHKSYQGLSRTEAELAYLKQAQKLPEYGIVYHRFVSTSMVLSNRAIPSYQCPIA